MSNQWNNATPKIWEIPPNTYGAGSSTSSQPYSSAPPGYYNAPPPTQQPLYNQQYAVAGTAQDYQQASQMMPGYSYNPATQLAPSNVLPQADASMVLNAVNTLNQSLGGLDIDPELLNALSRQIQNERESDQKPPHRAEIYSPTLNSPSPSPYHSPERRIEVDGKKLVTSKPFYEQFNHYEDDLANDDMTSRVDQFLSATTSRRSRSPRDRTWAGSNSPPSPGRRDMNSRSPLSHRPRLDDKRGMTHRSRHEDSVTRRGRSRSPLRRTRSRSREIEVDRSLGEKVTVLLEMSKSENRKFVSSQQPSSVLMVVNLIRYISDKDLWGAIHKYARDYGTKPPFYIEKASFTLSKTIPMTFLALIAFPTVSAAEMCMKHTNCELEIAGRVKKHFKMMYYSENTILFDALNSKFTGIWRSVLKQRLRLRRGEGDDDRDSKSPRESRSRDRSKSKDRARLMESECVRSDNKRKSIEKRKSPDCKPDKSESNSSKLSNRAQTGKLRENQKSVKDETPDSDSEESCKSPTKTKAQPNVNIIKTNVFIGKMKSYLVNQNKNKPEKIEINITSSSIGGQSSSAKKDLDPKQPAKSSNKSIPPKAENKKDVEKVTPKVSQTAPKDVPLPPLPPREKNKNETGTPSTNTAEISNSKLSTDSKTTKDYEKQKQPTKKVEENKVFKENETVSKEISKGKSATANIKVEPKKENNTSNNPQKSSAKTSTAVCSSNTTKQSPSDKSSESNETKSLKRKDDVQSDNLKKSVDKTPTTKKAQIVKEKSSDDGKLKPEKDCSNASLSSIPIPDLIVKTEPTHVDEKKKEPTKNVADIKEPKENKTPPKEEKVAPKLGKVSATNTPKTEVKNEKSESKTSSVKILEKVDQTETSQKAPVKTNTDVVKPNSKSTDINTSIPKASGTAQKSKENENDPQNRSKRKISPPRSENVRSVKPKTNDQDGAINDLVTPPQQKEDSISDQEREEEEAELFGARLDKYSNREIGKQSYKALHKDRGFKRGRGFDRRDDSSYNQGRAQSREDRFSRDNRGRGGYNDRRPNRDYQDKRRRGDDDIDGNEDGYWNTTRESKQQPAPVNPWIQNETPNDKNTSLSLNELKDPEFLLRVLLQTSIMIQNNQLTMDNPLDSLTPTDKELILQTLNEIEATSQVVIYATVNNRSTFNAAEQRVLTEALSNIHMFKAALIPPGNKNQEEMKKDVRPLVCHKKEEADVYVSMSNIHTWISKDFIVKILRNLNLNFECVEIYPCLKNDSTTSGHIKFKDFETASELLRKTNRTLYVGKDPSGIQLSISDVAKRSPKWVCNSCSMRNSSETVICMKCQKLKEKLADIQVTTEVTNKLVLINFKKETTVDEMQKILMKIAPFLTATVVTHIDSTNDQVVHFIIELVNPQACSMMKKAIRDHMEEFSRFQAGPRVAISFVIPQQLPPATSTNNKYTFADVPRLAHYSASLYATNEEERMKYFNHYTTLYTQELVLGNPINVVLPEDTVQTVTGPPTGSDDRLWPPPHVNGFTYDQNSGYYYDHSTGLYYEPSSQYFYNMDTRKFLLYDTGRSTYVLVQNNSEISSAPVKSVAKPPSTITNPTTRLPQESQDDQNMEKTGNASCPPTKESRIHAKKVMKDLEKWSKSVNKQDKKKAAPNVFDQYANSGEKASPADVGFDIMRRTETVKSSTSASVSSVPSISSLIMEHTVCEDEEEEYAFIDLKNFTCNLCHRVFNSADVLNKHSKLSDLHRNNLKKWYISKNLDPDNEENRKQQYRDRAAERRNKTTGKQRTRHEGRGSSPVETWLCGTPGCMVYKRSGFDLCYDCEKDADSRSRLPPPGPKYTPTPPVSDLSVGSQLLKKMGWEQGSGLGKMRQGTRQPIQVEKQSGYQGVGAQKQELREEGESYMAFLKRSTQKRYEQLSNDY